MWIAISRRALVYASIASALAGSLLAQPPAARPVADGRLRAATRALAAGDAEGALQLGTAYLKQHPGSREAQLLLVQIHIEREDPDAAVAWAGLWTSLVKLRRTADGIAKLHRAIALEPTMAEAHYMLGMAYQGAGDAARADAAFKKAEQLRSR